MEHIFDARIARVGQEMKRLYMSLYHDEHAYEYFVSMLRRSYGERKAQLRALDEERLARPDWFRERGVLGMLMYTQCFGGTLKGVQSHLDYLQETGVNYLLASNGSGTGLTPLLDRDGKPIVTSVYDE